MKKFFKDGLAKDNLTLFIMLNIFNFLNFLYHFIVARVLTKADYGILITLFSIIYIFNVPAEAIQNISSRITSKFNIRNENGKIKYFVKRSLKKGVFLSFIIFIILTGLSFFLSNFLNINILLIVLTNIMIFFFILAPVSRGVLQGKKRFFVFGFSFVLESALRLIFSFLFVIIGWKVYGAVLGVLLGLAFGFFVSTYFIKDILIKKEEPEKLNDFYKFSLPFFVIALVVFFMFSIDTILARRFFSPDIAGNYAALSTLGKIIFFGTASIGKAMFPAVSEKFEENKSTSGIFKKSFSIIIILSIIALLFYYLIPEFIIKLTVGSKFLEVSNLLIYSGIGMTILSFSNLVLLYGLSVNRLKGYYFLIVFAIIEIILLILFHNSLKTYLIAFIVSNLIMFIGTIFMIKK